MTLKRFALRLGGLSATLAAIVASGPSGIWLVFGLVATYLLLVVVSVLTGIFGEECRREAAQTVLALLLGRDQPGEIRARERNAVGQASGDTLAKVREVQPRNPRSPSRVTRDLMLCGT
jgi:hypothetical protein